MHADSLDLLDEERALLGAILAGDTDFSNVAAQFSLKDFSLDKHKRIFQRMLDLHHRGTVIALASVANELMSHAELEKSGGISYLVGLSEGSRMPE
jgi:replicative DNA helicase